MTRSATCQPPEHRTKYAYDPFGTPTAASGTTDNRFRYLGRHSVVDETNGLNYIRARYYSAQRGRFVTKDPMTGKDGDSQSLNRYVYALNNPLRLIDISGLSASESSGGAPPLATSDPSLRNNYLISPGTLGLQTQVTAGGSGQSGVVSKILDSPIFSSILNALPIVAHINLEGAGSATSVGGSSAIGVGLDAVPVAVEALNTEVSSTKAFDRLLPEYVQELKDGLPLSYVVNYAQQENYGFGYTPSVIRSKIVEEANREGVEVGQ